MFSIRYIACIAKFLFNEAGALALSFAIAAPALLVVAGVATDYAFMVRYRTELQTVADAAAIAGARELSLAQTQTSQVTAVVDNFVKANAASYSGFVTVDTAIASDGTSVDVTLSRVWAPFFAEMISNDVTPVVASSTATLIGSTKVCVIGLDEGGKDTVRLDNSAMLTANNCAVYSNSSSNEGLVAGNSTHLKSSLSCTAGGYKGPLSAFDPEPLTDCPKIDDPLADRAPPTVGGCDYNNMSLNGTDQTLLPGVYCGGLSIANATINFSPGVFVIKDGDLSFNPNANIIGDGVGFYLTGNSQLKFNQNTSIQLTAPKNGPLAGLLFFEDRSDSTTGQHQISSDDAKLLLGTIYLPAGKLIVDANKPVADQSAYTAIVVRQLRLKNGPNLVLNSDYDSTDVPLPSGLKNLAGSRIALTK